MNTISSSSRGILSLICAMGLLISASVFAMSGTASSGRGATSLNDSQANRLHSENAGVTYAYDAGTRLPRLATGGPFRIAWCYRTFGSTTRLRVVVAREASHAYDDCGDPCTLHTCCRPDHGLFWGSPADEAQSQPASGHLNSGTTCYCEHVQYEYDCWLSEDHIQESDGPNLYGYVMNGPTGAIDPLGLDLNYVGPNPDGRSTDWKATAEAQSRSGFYDVDGHGGTYYFLKWDPSIDNGWKKPKGGSVSLTASELALIIYNDPAYRRNGETVRLNACNVGSPAYDPKTLPNYATQLARALSKLNGVKTEVYAPDKWIQVRQDGTGWDVGDKDNKNPGGTPRIIPGTGSYHYFK